MPLQLLSAESREGEDLSGMDRYLTEILDTQLPNDHLAVIERRYLGKVSHTFSHIQLTIHVQIMVLKVCFLSYYPVT